MLGMFVLAVIATTTIKLFFAICGHRITWRLAVALLALIVLFATAHTPPR